VTITHRRGAVGALAVCAVAAVAATALTVTNAYADGPELISNGTFEDGHAPWWGTPNLTLDSSSGQLCADIPGGGNPWDTIIGYNGVPLQNGESYVYKFFATATPARTIKAIIQLPMEPWTAYVTANPELSVSGNEYTYSFTSPVDLPDAQIVFQLGGAAEPWRYCMDNASLTGGAPPPVYVPDTGPRIRVNQTGYLPNGPKNATLVTEATEPLPFRVVDSAGTVITRGRTVPRGVDASSGQNVHSLHFTWLRRPASGLRVQVDGQTSHPFDIGTAFYE
jgi:endoglucanase